LRDQTRARQALQLLNRITAGFDEVPAHERKTSSVRTLRQALA